MRIPPDCARTALLCVALPLLLHAQTQQAEPQQAELQQAELQQAELQQAELQQDGSAATVEPTLPAPAISNERILGVIPDFQTVDDPKTPYVPLRPRDKWWLFVKESVDPYAFLSAAAGAGISQWRKDDPKYGVGVDPYMQRFGAAQADLTSQNFFQDAILATLFHEDPRYFRKGPGSTVFHRIIYAMSRAAITRRDSGENGFNFSGILGMEMGIALSNAYYPPKSVNGEEVAERTFTSFTATALGNLLPEFWPDIRERWNHFKHKQP